MSGGGTLTRLKLDLGVGVLGSLWSAALGIACVPLFIQYLGIESYGLIGFFVTTQALAQLLEMGLAPTVNREVARCGAAGRPGEAATVVHSVARVYWCVAVAMSLLVVALSGPVARGWLQSQQLTNERLQVAVALMGVVIGCRWPAALYHSVLLGSMRARVASGIGVVMSTLSNLGALAVLAWGAPTIEAFFLWQGAVALLNTIVMRAAAWQAIGRAGRRFDLDSLRRIWRFAAGMAGVSVAGAVLMYADKLILSRLLPLPDFGRYALAGVVASGLYLLLTPTFNVIYPRMTALVARRDDAGLSSFYITGSCLLASVLFPIAATGAVFSHELLLVWTRDSSLADGAAPLVSLLLVGTALNGVMLFPYALQLSSGLTRLPLLICLLLIMLLVPLTIVFTRSYGAIGGAAAWATLNLTYVAVGVWMTHRKLLAGIGAKWVSSCVLIPGVCSSVVLLGCKRAIHSLDFAPGMSLALGMVAGALCIAALLIAPARNREVMRLMFPIALLRRATR